MGSVGDIWVNIGLKSTIARDSGKAKGAMSKLSSTVKQHGVMIGGAMTGMGAAMLMAGNKVDKAYAAIISGTGATGKALEDLKGSFHDVYGTIPADAQIVGDALATLNTLTGATGDTLEDLTVNIAEVSRMMGEDAAANAESFGQAMKQWQIPAEEGTELMDKMYKICQDTNIGFGNLTTQLNKYGAVMLNAGYTVEETAQMMGRLHASGIMVSRIMPGLNAAFRKWAKAGKDAKTELELTVKAIAESETSMAALAIATDEFGAEGAQRLVTAIRNGTFALDELDTGLDNTKGLIEATAKETLTFSDKLALWKNKATEALAPLQGIGAALTVMGPLLMATSGFMTLSAASAGAGTIAYAQYAIAELGVAAATKVLTIALLANPLFWIPAAIAGVAAALYILEKRFGVLTHTSKVLNMRLDELKDTFGGLGTTAGEAGVKIKTTLDILVAHSKTAVSQVIELKNEYMNFTRLLYVPASVIAGPFATLGIAFSELSVEMEETGEASEEVTEKIKDLNREIIEASLAVEAATARKTETEEAWRDAVAQSNKESETAITADRERIQAALDLETAVETLETRQNNLNTTIAEGGESYRKADIEAKSFFNTLTAAPDTLSTTFELETPSISQFIMDMETVEAQASLTKRAIAVMGNPAMLIEYEDVLLDIITAQNDLNVSTKRTGELSSEVLQLVSAYNELEDTIKRISDLTESISDQERAIKSAEIAAIRSKNAFADMMSEAGLSASQISSILAQVSEEGDINNDLFEQLGETSRRTGVDLQSSYLRALGDADRLSDSQRRAIELAEEEKAAKKHAAEAGIDVGSFKEMAANLKTKKTELEAHLDKESIIKNNYKELEKKEMALLMDAEITEYERFRTWLVENPGEAEIIIKRYETTGAGTTTAPISSSGISASNTAATNIYGATPTPGSFTAAVANVSGAAAPTNVTVTVNAEIHNNSDVMDMEDKVAKATQMGVHNALGIR